MSTIQQELWNIFTFYTLHGNPRDPSKMGSIPLAKLCKDMMVFDATMTERPLTQADLNIIFTGEIKKQLKVGYCIVLLCIGIIFCTISLFF